MPQTSELKRLVFEILMGGLTLKSILKKIYQWVMDRPHRWNLFLVNIGVIEKYQPLWGISDAKSGRDCSDRWGKIKPNLPTRPFSFLDTGSQLGYFTFSAAEYGAVAMGLERVPAFFQVAQSIRHLKKVSSATFLNMELNPESVKALPSVDVICCMSVFHHWVLDWGEEGAVQLFSDLCSKTQAIIFETGQQNEVTEAFSKHMGFMGEDHRVWIENTLK